MANSDRGTQPSRNGLPSAGELGRLLPIANISRIMKTALPSNAKISMDAQEAVRECGEYFISFVTSEASDKCQRERRLTIDGDDLLWAMNAFGFDDYVLTLKAYFQRFRVLEAEKLAVARDESVAVAREILPKHLVVDEILCRLPVKTLTRFTLVCKAWRDSISNPEFYHLPNAKPDKDFFLVRPDHRRDFALAEVKGNAFWPLKLVKPRPQVCPDRNLVFLGHCDGVICLGNRHNSDPFCIMNPITGEYMELPEIAPRFGGTVTSGFGVTSGSKQYKVVAIRRRFTEVWTVGEDDWRNIGCRIPETYKFNGTARFSEFFQGSLHWIVNDANAKLWLICVFDLETETFHSISLPTRMYAPWKLDWWISPRNMDLYLELGMVRERLVVYVCDHEPANPIATVWEMDEYGNEESWTKKFNVGPSADAGVSIDGILCEGYRLIWVRENNREISKCCWLGMFSQYKNSFISIDAYVPTLASPWKMIDEGNSESIDA